MVGVRYWLALHIESKLPGTNGARNGATAGSGERGSDGKRKEEGWEEGDVMSVPRSGKKTETRGRGFRRERDRSYEDMEQAIAVVVVLGVYLHDHFPLPPKNFTLLIQKLNATPPWLRSACL